MKFNMIFSSERLGGNSVKAKFPAIRYTPTRWNTDT